jgi:hypothetical protein
MLQRIWHTVTTREGNTSAARSSDYVMETAQMMRSDAAQARQMIDDQLQQSSGIWQEDMMRGVYRGPEPDYFHD